jgi:hypothetical protein
MPHTLEIVCHDQECTLDMFEVHETYAMPDDTGAEAYRCPYCGDSDSLEAVEL